MIAVRLLVLNLILLALSACNSGGGGGESVKINTGGIYNPVSLSNNDLEIQPVHDLGEFLLGTPKKVFSFKLRNNSLYYINQINLTLEGFSSFGFKFNKDQNGVSAYPGYLGTCADSLPPGGTCTIYLQFETSIKGQYDQDITFHYKNLVEEQSRPLKLVILAGNAASLVFDGEETNYTFGEKVGVAQVPVVEKEDRVNLEKTLTITNAGDLRARDIKLLLTQTCSSELDGECPVGQNAAYTFTTNCPAILPAEQSCQTVIKFAPKNYDADINLPDPALAQIRFNSNLKYDYLNSQEGPNNKAALNAYVTSVSTRIEGNFKTSIDSLPFEGQTVVGNRVLKSVRVINKGYRAGKLHKLIIEQGASVIGHCVKESSSLFMNCYTDASLSTPVPLSTFPFYFRDKNACFGTTSLTDGVLVSVDGGCQLDIFFQPSVAFKTSGTSTFKLNAFFDSRWKDAETLKTNFFLQSTGTYLAAARLVPEKIAFDNKLLTMTSLHSLNEIASFDLGRLGMMSSNSFKRKSLDVTFINEGGVVAEAISASDGWGITIPKKEDNPTGVHLKPSGGDNKPLYADAKIATAYCNQIPPGGRCTVTINFAPISKGSVEATRTYAFDQNNLVDPSLSYKSFFMSYKDGSSFSDMNRTDSVDSGPASAQAQFKVNLVARGVLGEFNEDKLGSYEIFPFSKAAKGYVLLSNIGTDKIRYLGYRGGTFFNSMSGMSIVASDLTKVASENSSSIYGPLKDCMDIVDFNYNPGDNCAVVESKIYSATNPSGKGFLNPDESCALTFQHQPTVYVLNSAITHELQRPSNSAFENTINAWTYGGHEVYFHAYFHYYNNDLNAPGNTGNLTSCVGGSEISSDVNSTIRFNAAATIHPHSPYPNAAAILYRKAQNLVELRSTTNALYQPAAVIPESWYFSEFNVGSIPASGEISSDVVTASRSVNHFPAQVSISPLNISNYDFVVHLGTFPTGKTVRSGFHISAMVAGLQGKWKGSTSSLVMKPPASTVSNQFGYDFSIPMNKVYTSGGIVFPATVADDIRINFTPDAEGIYANEFSYSYTNGDYVSTPSTPVTITQKVLIIAEAIADAPDLGVEVARYKVEPDGFSEPVLTPTGPSGFTPSDYSVFTPTAGDQATTDFVLLDAVKVPTPSNVDFYVRTHVVIKNKSLTRPMTDLKLLPKTSAASPITTSLNLGADIKFCFDNSSTSCAGTCSGVTTLSPGASCYFEVFYRPSDNQQPKDIVVQANYHMQTDQYFSQNITFSFMPKDPANLIAVGKSRESVRVNIGNIASYGMDLLTDKEITADPQIIAFDKSVGINKRLEVTNSSTTRASFLKAYHEFIGTTNINAIPADSDFNYNSDGIDYALIYQRNYSNGQPRIQVYANKPCLIGGTTPEEASLPLFKKGFNIDNTANPCYLSIILLANSHYMNIDLNTSSAALMEPNHVRLPYYNNDRSSFAYFNIHFTGKLKPPASLGAPNTVAAYKEVKASSNGTVTFKWNEMTPKNAALGAIVGYRVYYSTSQTALDNIYSAQSSYVDTAKNGTGNYQLTQNSNAQKRFYYYRVVPIREYNDYNPTQTFSGVTPFYQMAAKRYISETGVPKMGVVIPPTDMFYDHARQLLIYRDVKSSDLLTVEAARTACSGMTKLRLSRSGGNADFTQRLITTTAWSSILDYSNESAYDPYNLTVWLDGTTQNIHTKLLNYAGYNPADEAKYLTADHVFYQKTNNCQPSCTGDLAVGAVYHNPEYAGYESYISTGYVFGSARCHVDLNLP